MPRIVEVDYVELNVRLVLVLVLEQMVIDDKAQVGKLEIIAIKRITFLYLLLDELVDDTGLFTSSPVTKCFSLMFLFFSSMGAKGRRVPEMT